MSLKLVLNLAAAIALGAMSASADVVELKDAASVSGKILADRRDSVVVDVGYTVLVIPKSSVTKIISGEQTVAPKTSASGKKSSPAVSAQPGVTTPVATVISGLYSVGNKAGGERNVRDLVNQLGEAVVQVRTPGGLGSGFFLNEEGFLRC